MQERHLDRKKYFNEQIYTTEKYVIPFLGKYVKLGEGSNILEIGSGEGGNLKPFLDLGLNCVGIDISEKKIENGKIFFENHRFNNKLNLIVGNIYDFDSFEMKFDLIIMRDTIEHIPEQDLLLNKLKNFLKPNGIIFIGFPPWQNPFGGHQQICSGKILSHLPYYHLLPKKIYSSLLKFFGEPESRIEALLEIKDTGISIERFFEIVNKSGYEIIKTEYFLFNPNYEIKFGLKPKRQFGLVKKIPYLRNFFTTALYALIKPKVNSTEKK